MKNNEIKLVGKIVVHCSQLKIEEVKSFSKKLKENENILTNLFSEVLTKREVKYILKNTMFNTYLANKAIADLEYTIKLDKAQKKLEKGHA